MENHVLRFDTTKFIPACFFENVVVTTFLRSQVNNLFNKSQSFTTSAILIGNLHIAKSGSAMIARLNNIMVRFDGFQAIVRVPGVYARQVVNA